MKYTINAVVLDSTTGRPIEEPGFLSKVRATKSTR